MTPTKSRQNADASLTTRRTRSLTLTPMSNPATASIPFRHLRVLAASLALALGGVRHARAEALGRCAGPIRGGDGLRRASPRSPGGKATGTRCCPTSSAAQRSRTATSRSRPSACAPRAPARRSAARGCCRASASAAAGFDHSTDYDSAAQAGSSRTSKTRAARGARASRGKSTSAVACARVQRQPPPTRWPPKTARAACACWC